MPLRSFVSAVGHQRLIGMATLDRRPSMRRATIVSVAGRTPHRAVPRVAPTAVFTERELHGLPEPVCRYFACAIAPHVPLDSGVHVDVRGAVRRDLATHPVWLPFEARYHLTRRLNFAGFGHAAEILVGVERHVAGSSSRRVRLAGVFAVDRAARTPSPRDVAQRAALGGLVLPTALLPRFGTSWTASGDDLIHAAVRVHDVPVILTVRIDGDGRPLEAVVDGGSPAASDDPSSDAVAVAFASEVTAGGLTVPRAGRATRWADAQHASVHAERMRFEITALRRRPHTAAARRPAVVS